MASLGRRRGRGGGMRLRSSAVLGVVALVLSAFVFATPQVAGAITSTWTSRAAGPSAGTHPTIAYDEARAVDVLFTESGQTWIWNGSAWAQQNPSTSPSPR